MRHGLQPKNETKRGETMTKQNAATAANAAEQDRPETIRVPIRVGPAGKTPLYASIGAAGCDLFAAAPLTLRPGETRLLALDLVMAIPAGVEAQIRPRSGLSLKTSLRLPNAPGTIDSDYRNGVAVLVQNTFSLADLPARILAQPQILQDLAAHYRRVPLACCLPQTSEFESLAASMPDLAGQAVYLDEQGNPYGTIYIQAGERVAQMIFSRYLLAEFDEHPEPEAIGADRGGGFGSTGLH
jgi:dUTP pyrophosphatase